MDYETPTSFKLVTVGIVGLVVVLLLWLLTGPISVIGPGERGVEVKQGLVTGKVYTEGWYIYNSILNDIVKFDTRTQLENVKAAAASQDLQDVSVEVAVQYRLETNKVADILKNIGRQDDVKNKIIDPAVQETVKASTALFPVADIIKERPTVKAKIEALLIDRMAPYGVILEELSLKDISFSDQFSKAIEEKQVAEQQKLKAQFEADSNVITAKGKAEAQSIEGTAIRLNPEILKLRAIEKWNGVYPQVLAGDSGQFIFQLPN